MWRSPYYPFLRVKLQWSVHSACKQRSTASNGIGCSIVLVENEMFLRFNQNVLTQQVVDESCAEMDDDFDASSHMEAFALWEEAEASVIDPSAVPAVEEEDYNVEEQKSEPLVAAAAASSSRPSRTDSSVIRRNQDFIDKWIDDNGVTPAFQFTREVRNRLENDAWERNRGGLSTKELEKQIRAEAQRRALEDSEMMSD